MIDIADVAEHDANDLMMEWEDKVSHHYNHTHLVCCDCYTDVLRKSGKFYNNPTIHNHRDDTNVEADYAKRKLRLM